MSDTVKSLTNGVQFNFLLGTNNMSEMICFKNKSMRILPPNCLYSIQPCRFAMSNGTVCRFLFLSGFFGRV